MHSMLFRRIPLFAVAASLCALTACEPVDESQAGPKPDPSENTESQDPKTPEPSVDEDFGGSMLKKFDTLNRYACTLDLEMCVADWAKASEDMVQTCFEDELDSNDVAAKAKADHGTCILEALDDSRSCTDKSDETCAKDDGEACNKAMKGCLSDLEQEIGGCKAEDAKPSKVFDDTLSCVRAALDAGSDDTGGDTAGPD